MYIDEDSNCDVDDIADYIQNIGMYIHTSLLVLGTQLRLNDRSNAVVMFRLLGPNGVRQTSRVQSPDSKLPWLKVISRCHSLLVALCVLTYTRTDIYLRTISQASFSLAST